MRYLLAILCITLALPAAAATTNKECRGKKAFELSDGTSGCLLEIKETTVTSTLSRDDGQSKSRKAEAVLVAVGLFGSFDTNIRVTSKRIQEVCSILKGEVAQGNGGAMPKNVIVHMVWPGVQLPKPTRANGGQYLNQVPQLNKSCRSPQYFGTRTR